ncbi:MAG: hypothetical protein AB7T10_04820 [bacterium]
MKKALLFVLLLSTVMLWGYPLYNFETIKNPTTHIIPPKTYNISFEMLPNAGLGFSANISLFPRVMFGLSYSATDIISYEIPAFSKYPGFLVKVVIVEEEEYVPAVAFGLQSQGYGAYDTTSARFDVKSKGFYANVSKILYPPIGEFMIGGGMNYSIFENSVEKMVDFFAQAEYYLTDNVGFLIEYSLGLDDNDGTFGRGVGYLNAGMKWIYEEKLGIEIDFVDLVKNNTANTTIGRGIKISYTDFF